MMRLFYSGMSILAAFLIMASVANAQGLIPQPSGSCSGELKCYLGKCVSSGEMSGAPSADALPCNYALSDILQTGINGINLIFGISGSIALALFVWGGFMWLMSAGSPEKIKKGTEILKNSAIALIIILGASVIVRFFAADILGLAVTPGGQLKTPEAACANAANGASCGDNSVCFSRACITKCDYKAATDAARAGYSCQLKLAPGAGDCEEGLCPGGESTQCCITNERRTEIQKSQSQK